MTERIAAKTTVMNWKVFRSLYVLNKTSFCRVHRDFQRVVRLACGRFIYSHIFSSQSFVRIAAVVCREVVISRAFHF